MDDAQDTQDMQAEAGEAAGGHRWVAAATVPLDDAQAKRAVLRHSVWTNGQTRFDVLETYCSQCRRPFDDVADEPCVAATSTEHLRGGPIGTRRKRKHNHNCAILGCWDDIGREGGAGTQEQDGPQRIAQ